MIETSHHNNTSLQVLAFAAGLLYLIIIICGISSEVFIRSNLIEPGDATMTAANILAAEGLFRSGLLADLMMLASDVAIAILFYMIFKRVDKTLALVAAAFRLTQATIVSVSLLYYYAALLLLKSETVASAFNLDQLNALAEQLLDLHRHGYDLGLVFFAVSCAITGYLILKAERLSAVIGYGLIASAMVYLTGSLTRFLAPVYVPLIEPWYIVPLLAELAFCVYLLTSNRQFESIQSQ